MARFGRRLSEYGYYHIILRGVNRNDIVYDDMDRQMFVNAIKRFSKELEIDVIVYCIMNNHAHILSRVPDNLGLFVKKLASSYVYYFNNKYERIGHLFQDRYKSEPIESDSYLLTASRYILQNAEKVGICKTKDYHWNNWNDIYFSKGFTKPQVLFDVWDDNEPLLDYLLAENDDICMDIDSYHKFSDSDVVHELKRISDIENPLKVAELDLPMRNNLLAQLKVAGFSIRQISRVTGIDKNIVHRAK